MLLKHSQLTFSRGVTSGGKAIFEFQLTYMYKSISSSLVVKYLYALIVPGLGTSLALITGTRISKVDSKVWSTYMP